MENPAPQKRVVSLIASSTEIVCALGLGSWLVGRSHECDFPAEVRGLPPCTEPKFDTGGTSYEIDQRIKAILQEGLSVYRVSAETLDRLQPDLILTQTQCEVCAVSLRDVEEAACQLVSSRPQIVSLHPNVLDDVWADIGRVAEACGVPERGYQLVSELQARMQAITTRALRADRRPTLAYIEWIEPLMTGGNWMPELVAAANAQNLFGIAGKHSPFQSWESVVAMDPEVLFVAPCGFGIERTRSELHLLAERPEWPGLRAVREGRVFIADGHQFFNRPGPRLVESLEILAESLHPELFHFGHHGTGWVRYSGPHEQDRSDPGQDA